VHSHQQKLKCIYEYDVVKKSSNIKPVSSIKGTIPPTVALSSSWSAASLKDKLYGLSRKKNSQMDHTGNDPSYVKRRVGGKG
jgi:hypothetical protein